MEIKQEYLSYQEIRNGTLIKGDDYGLASYLGPDRKASFLNNPNLHDESDCLLALVRVDGAVVGREMLYPTKIKAGSTIDFAQSCSALDVHADFQHLAVGADLFRYYTKSTKYNFVLCSGISEQALPLYKVWRYHILEFPRLMFLCRMDPIVRGLGISDFFSKLLSYIPNFLIKIPIVLNNYRSNNIRGSFVIQKETIIPDWVEKLTTDNKYKYMEVHDNAWLQWNLDYNFKNDPRNIQSFYSIYKGSEPVGFFMTKERFRESAGGKLKNTIIGSIGEWGAIDESGLSEDIIYKLAFSTFSKKVDLIELATTNKNVIKRMKCWGFLTHGFAHIAFKDKTKQFNDASNIDLWRVRYGYADVILT